MFRQFSYTILLIVTLLYQPCVAQKQYKVFDWNGEGTLSSFLAVRAHGYYAQREKTVSKALTSKQTMLQYRDQSIRTFKELLGSRPDTGSMHPVITGTIARDGYSIQKLVFESFANHHVTANLYIPSGKGPFPAVLFFCGHEVEAKATVSYQKTAILFAKNGFVVLIADPISQGERFQLTDTHGTPLTRGGTAEHSLLNVGANLAGTSVAAYELWDNVRGLDYLETRAEVDKNRIGCLGNSGGGTQTAYMIGYDQRIKVSALCSYVLNNDPTIEYKGPPDGCVPIPGEIKAGLTDGDYFLMFLPKPVLVLAGRYDFIKYNRVSTVFAETKKAYAAVGAGEKASMLSVDDGHGISQPKREAAVEWFRKWLYNDNAAIKENDEPTLTVKELNCTTTGQVNSEFPGEVTVADYNKRLAPVVTGIPQRNVSTDDIRTMLGLQQRGKPVTVEKRGDGTKDGYAFQRVILRKPGTVPLPCIVFYPTELKRFGQVVIWLPEQGKNKLADSAGLVEKHLQQGDALIMADLRGLGEEADREAFNDTKYYNSTYRNCNTALLLGQPLAGQWVEDIETLIDFIGADTSLKKLTVTVTASGVATFAALHAVAIDKRIGYVSLEGQSFSSFNDLLKDPTQTDLYPYVIPSALQKYDLPDLIRLTGANRIHWQGKAK